MRDKGPLTWLPEGREHITDPTSPGLAHRLGNRPILLVFYFLAFWPLLVNNGIYWDDWALYDQAPRTLMHLFSELGSPLAAYLDIPLVAVPPVFAKWFVFVVLMCAMLALYQVLVRTSLFSGDESLFLTLFATLIPYNYARITAICARYALCYLLFLIAFLSVIAYMSKNRIVFRLAALVLFFISFDTNSLLFYYVVVLIYIAYCEREAVKSLKGAARRLVAYSDFVLIPIVFFAVKSLFFVPYGIYLNYNTIRAGSLNRSPYEFLVSLWTSFADVVWGSVALAASALVVTALLIAGAYWMLAKRGADGAPCTLGERGTRYRRFWLGALLFYAGILPYLAIGRDGATFGTEWESRDQLLLGVGAAFMLYYGLRYLSARVGIGVKLQRLVFAVLVAAFVVANAGMYLHFQVDWFKQASFVENVKSCPAVKDNSTFVVDDRATGLDAMARHIQFYEYNGMLKRAFGTETRLAAWGSDIGAFSDPEFLEKCVNRPQYNFQDYVYAAPTHTIIVEPGEREVGYIEAARLLVKELFSPASFRADVKDVLTVSVEPIATAGTTQ